MQLTNILLFLGELQSSVYFQKQPLEPSLMVMVGNPREGGGGHKRLWLIHTESSLQHMNLEHFRMNQIFDNCFRERARGGPGHSRGSPHQVRLQCDYLYVYSKQGPTTFLLVPLCLHDHYYS